MMNIFGLNNTRIQSECQLNKYTQNTLVSNITINAHAYKRNRRNIYNNKYSLKLLEI